MEPVSRATGSGGLAASTGMRFDRGRLLRLPSKSEEESSACCCCCVGFVSSLSPLAALGRVQVLECLGVVVADGVGLMLEIEAALAKTGAALGKVEEVEAKGAGEELETEEEKVGEDAGSEEEVGARLFG